MRFLAAILACFFCCFSAVAQRHASVQSVDTQPVKRYEVSGGVMHEVVSLKDSLRADSVARKIETDTLSGREIRRIERDTMTRYSALFRDTMPISRMTAISFVVPGFSQVHNRQAWKVPLLYGAVGSAVYYGLKQDKEYKRFKSHYDDLILAGASRDDSDMDYTQHKMIVHNTKRQLLFGAAAAAYIYFIGDGVINHPSNANNVKIATTLSTVLPGAGQVYNKSYWKAPIVMGVFASMAMMIDWNNRGYKRYKTAYELKMADMNDVVEPALQARPASEMLDYRKAYRRNRDLCIILTGAVYIINMVDAHVDAHMQTFDVTDDLDGVSLSVVPTFTNVTTMNRSGSVFGMGLTMRF